MSAFTVPPPLGTYAHLLPPSWTGQVAAWLAEDTPSFDYGGFVVGEEPQTAQLLGKGKSEVRSLLSSLPRWLGAGLMVAGCARAQAVLAGVPFVDEVFRQLNCT